ncbi:hypothetical protein E4U54_003289 [Claviceps lovelessii]|nr:hypothetical protein E4U54_003289 [Claviceps lovelessii]
MTSVDYQKESTDRDFICQTGRRTMAAKEPADRLNPPLGRSNDTNKKQHALGNERENALRRNAIS